MTAITTSPLTVRLPNSVLERLQLVAEQQQQSVEGIVAKIVSDSVESLTQQAETNSAGALSPSDIVEQATAQLNQAKLRLVGQSREELQASAKLELAPADKERALELLSLNAERKLTSEEQQELETFYAKTEAVATTRVAALWLLKECEKVVE